MREFSAEIHPNNPNDVCVYWTTVVAESLTDAAQAAGRKCQPGETVFEVFDPVSLKYYRPSQNAA